MLAQLVTSTWSQIQSLLKAFPSTSEGFGLGSQHQLIRAGGTFSIDVFPPPLPDGKMAFLTKQKLSSNETAESR